MNWIKTTEERFDEMLGVLPPAMWLAHGFLVGEPWDHDRQGRPRFAAFVQVDGVYYESAGPMTGPEFRAFQASDVERNVIAGQASE